MELLNKNPTLLLPGLLGFAALILFFLVKRRSPRRLYLEIFLLALSTVLLSLASGLNLLAYLVLSLAVFFYLPRSHRLSSVQHLVAIGRYLFISWIIWIVYIFVIVKFSAHQWMT